MCNFPDKKDNSTKDKADYVLSKNILNNPKHMIYLLYFAILIEV